MLHEDYPQENIQAFRSVDKSIHPNSIPLASPEEMYHVETQVDPDTQKDVVLWDDILQAFENAVQVRHKIKVVPFLKGKDLRILEPRRIAAVPNIVLDVVVDTPVTGNAGVASLQIRQLELQPVPPQDDSTIKVEVVEVVSQDAISTPSATSTPIAVTAISTPNATYSSSSPTATSTVRRNPVYGLVEAAMENYTHIDRPLAFPSARGPQAVLDDQPPTIKDPVVPPHSVNSSDSQLQGPQSVITNVPMEKDVVQVSISASHGDKDAQVALGDMYKNGKGVAQDYQAAMDWYLKAVEQGDAVGQQRVGALYDEGLGVSQNYSTAMDWYLMAAEQGHAVALHSIEVLYNHDRLVPQERARAVELYLKAAKGGHAGSQYNIGEFYLGRGVRQDYKQAMDWFLMAAQQGHAKSQFIIGLLYDNGEGVPQDYAQAMEWYLKAANQGHSTSQYKVGYFYNYGQGVRRNYKQAMEWYLKAAMQENDDAQFGIGFLYNNGEGVPQDFTKAVEWYTKAANRGHGLAKTVMEAVEWFPKAADGGHELSPRE